MSVAHFVNANTKEDLGTVLARDYAFAHTVCSTKPKQRSVIGAACPACDVEIRDVHTSPLQDLQQLAERERHEQQRQQKRRRRNDGPKRLYGTRPVGDYSELHTAQRCAILTYVVNFAAVAGLCPQCGRSRRNIFYTGRRKQQQQQQHQLDSLSAAPGPLLFAPIHPVDDDEGLCAPLASHNDLDYLI
jgi:hypothetical protein